MNTNIEPGKDYEFHASRPHPLSIAVAAIALAIVILAVIFT